MIYNDEVNSHLVIFEIFGEVWVSFRGTQMHDISGALKVNMQSRYTNQPAGLMGSEENTVGVKATDSFFFLHDVLQ